MSGRQLRISALAVVAAILAACSGNSNAAGRDSTAAAVADSQPGVNAPSDTGVRRDTALQHDTATGMSMQTDGRRPIKKP